jgi:TonB-dependent SusC/RagA subfamily outer membrane receptor
MLNKQKKRFRLAGHLRIGLALLFFLSIHGFVIAQDVTVQGIVTAKDGNGPLTGVSIMIQGTTRGTISDFDGKFSFTAPLNSTLKFSYTGYFEQIIELNGQTNLSVVMEINTSLLNEVIVVGYGSQEAKDVTGAVGKIKAEALREVPAPNLIAQLKGRTAGVSIVNNSSTPGASGQIRIRGNRSLTTTNGSSDALDAPLLIVDGIPYGGSINDLNPDDITSLDILKDASATAIYGSRGSGGVILITTRRGKSGKAVITYDGYHGISNIMSNYKVKGLSHKNLISFKASNSSSKLS